jgi:putative cell wall-binding protein
MIEWTVYFEIYGKKMKTTVTAASESEAIEKVKSKLKINKVVCENDMFNNLMGIFNGNGQ